MKRPRALMMKAHAGAWGGGERQFSCFCENYYFSVGQNKTFEGTALNSGKPGWTFFISRLGNNVNNSYEAIKQREANYEAF